MTDATRKPDAHLEPERRRNLAAAIANGDTELAAHLAELLGEKPPKPPKAPGKPLEDARAKPAGLERRGKK